MSENGQDDESRATDEFRCGYVGIIGRPNVGKSTLLNQILGQKISITSRRPQTTRNRIVGIHTTEQAQAIFVDTPGIHQGGKRAINRYMNRAAKSILNDVDILLWVVDAKQWKEEDEAILTTLKTVETPMMLVLNKIDQLKNKDALLPLIERLSKSLAFIAVVPLSARRGTYVDSLLAEVEKALPVNEPVYPEDRVTDRSMRFIASEIIREKLTRRLGQEMPYVLAVEIEKFSESAGKAEINALIWVERNTQKAIVVGDKGQVLKEVGTQAREDLEKIMECKVYLELWVKVKEGWSEDVRHLRNLGYDELE